MRKSTDKDNQSEYSKKAKSVLQEELVTSELRYRRLFETAKDGILILDAETGKIVDVNPFLIDLLGYSKKSFQKNQSGKSALFKILLKTKINSGNCSKVNMSGMKIYRWKLKVETKSLLNL